MSDMKSQVVASVIGAVTGVIATALIGFLQVVNPIKGELDIVKKELVGLELRYMYGEVNRESRQNGFGLEVFNVERLAYGKVRVKLLLSNLVEEEREL